MLEGKTLSCPAAVPDPLSGTDSVGSAALELVTKFPVTLPPTLGANVTLNVTLWFAESVTGEAIPAKLNPDPLDDICEMVNAEPPTFVSVAARVLLLPVAIGPKFRLVGLAASCAGATAVPDSGTFIVELAALELIARFPLAFPVAVGAKATLKLALWPIPSVKGSVNPDALNPDPVMLMEEIVTLVPPEFVRVSVKLCELPT
jgi:hypothetical protein